MILNAVLCVWNEEDIIESTVKHLFAQGCSNVFVIDNDSTDNTVQNAINAGAKLATQFKTTYFSEDQKIAHLNTVVKYINEITSEEKIWWLYVDADEFPHIEGGGILVKYLKEFDSSVRAIHGYMYHHKPTHPPYHIQGYHPIDFQALCTKSDTPKIPLIRYDKGKPHLWSTGGAHDFATHNETIAVIKDCLHIHHFPYRNPEYTFKRLKKLVDRNNDAMRRDNWHREFSNQISKAPLAQYDSRYNQLHTMYSQNKYLELKTHSLQYNYRNIIRWYDMHIQRINNQISYERSIWLAMYYFFMKEYDFAICKFNDIFNHCSDMDIKPWVMMKIAECLEYTDMNETRNIISYIKKYDNSELNAYIDKHFDHNTDADYKNKDMIYKIELYQSEFATGSEDGYKKIIAKIEENIARDINENICSGH